MMQNKMNYDNLDVMNPAPRCPLVLLLDVSRSMFGQPIAELNAAVRQFIDETRADEAASMSVDLEVITFGSSANVLLPFSPMNRVSMLAPLEANGMTAMGAALRLAARDLSARRKLYKTRGLSSYRPFVVLMTDGEPNDDWREAAQKLRGEAERGRFTYIGVEIGNRVNHAKMCEILPVEPGPVKMRGLRFKQFFHWLTDSLRSVSASTVAEQDKVVYGSVGGWTDL